MRTCISFVTAFAYLSICKLSMADMQKQKKAVVIGGTGATGREVIKSLLAKNWDVLSVSRRVFAFEGISEEQLTRLTQVVASDFTDKGVFSASRKNANYYFAM